MRILLLSCLTLLGACDNLQALRIENGMPKPLDAEAIPAYL